MAEQRELPNLIAAELDGLRDLSREALREVTPKELAFHLPPNADGEKLNPKSVDNQFRIWSPRNHPSLEAGYILRRQSTRYDEAVAKLMGRVVGPQPRMTPEQFARAVQERGAKGYVTSAEIAQLSALTNWSRSEPEYERGLPVLKAVKP